MELIHTLLDKVDSQFHLGVTFVDFGVIIFDPARRRPGQFLENTHFETCISPRIAPRVWEGEAERR